MADDLKYRLDEAVAKTRRAQNTSATVREQLPSVRSNVDEHRHCLSLYTVRSTSNFSDGSSNFLYNVSTVVKQLVENQRS